MTREDFLKKAGEIITGDRNNQYGPPEDSFSTISKLWQTYLDARQAAPLQPHDVAAMMTLLKIARIAVQPDKADSWIDGTGYLACGGSLIAKDEPGEDKQKFAEALRHVITVSPEDSYASMVAKKALNVQAQPPPSESNLTNKHNS